MSLIPFTPFICGESLKPQPFVGAAELFLSIQLYGGQDIKFPPKPLSMKLHGAARYFWAEDDSGTAATS